MKLFRIIRLSFYAFFALAVSVGYFVYISAIAQPLENREQTLVVPNGVGISWLARHLEKQGIIENRYVFRIYAWVNNRHVSIKAGEYTLVDIDSIPDLIAKVDQGKVIQYAITLIEGKTYKEYRAKLISQKLLVDQLESMTDAEVMRELGSPGKNPEGLFAPQTYFFEKGDTDFDVLKQAFKRLDAVAEDAWNNRADDVEVKTKYELITLASIIEKETGAAFERPTISGVFNNRLRVGMRLQTDPTVIYGMGESYDGNIRRKDLRTDTPYNTYTRYGLPPSPIAMPGEAAIRAAANPQKTEFLYFVGKGDGTHSFSKTLTEHNNAVVKYQLGGKRRTFSSNPTGD
ncbi:MAG: UPF0755 protein [Arenicella sp.]|jgi:UPF0755 protein